MVFGPLEKTLQNHREGVEEGVPSQEHLSLWQASDFEQLGFTVEVVKDFHREKGDVWDACWALWEPVRPADEVK